MMPLYIRPSDYYQMLRPVGPLFAFIVPWLLVIIGQELELCHIIVPKYSIFYWMIFGNMLTLLAIAAGIQALFPQNLSFNKDTFNDIAISRKFKQITYGLLVFYLSLMFFQFYHFRGFPLLWLFQGSVQTYVEFGIPSLNGLLHAVYLLSTTMFTLIYFKNKSYLKLLLLFCLFLFPVILVNRQVFMGLFLQITCCCLIYNPKLIKRFFIWGGAIIVIFIVIGNVRTHQEVLVEILQPKSYIPTFLYPLLWIYAYIVTPFNNINAGIDSITPLDFPYHELRYIVPSIWREALGAGSETGFAIVHSNMTASTFYYEPLLDYGKLYAFTFMALFQLLLFLSYRKAVKTKSPLHIIEYSIFYMMTVLSIFDNLFLYLPVLAQLVIIYMLKPRLIRQRLSLNSRLHNYKLPNPMPKIDSYTAT